MQSGLVGQQSLYLVELPGNAESQAASQTTNLHF